MSVETALPIEFSDAAAAKVKALVSEEENPDLKLRVYVTGGGCSGFQYGFTFDEKVNEGDMTIEKDSVTMVVDPMSLQYLVGGVVDYVDGLEGSRFLVQNPNATTTCGKLQRLNDFVCSLNRSSIDDCSQNGRHTSHHFVCLSVVSNVILPFIFKFRLH
jgi:iron-sulfur cluster insertion protein